MVRKRLVTQADVARAADVSQGAVSSVLGQWSGRRLHITPGTAERIRRVALELGYRPNVVARQLRGCNSKLLAIVVGRGSPPILFERLWALEREAARSGYRSLIMQLDPDLTRVQESIADLAARGVDGVVCMGHEYADSPAAVPIMLSCFESVVYLREPAIEGATWVHIDGAACMRQAVAHLCEGGRRRICVQIGDRVHQAYTDRLAAYLEAMGGTSHNPGTDLVWFGDDFGEADPQVPDAAQAEKVVDTFVRERGADAMILTNDHWAALMVKVLKRRGLEVPGDVAVVGQGNFPVGTLVDPEITTLDPNTALFAKEAVAALVSRIEGVDGERPAGQVALVSPTLIVRDSS